jgi:GNAT superfamily N-acetyltransferase
VRTAVPGDAAALAALQLRAWRALYGDALPELAAWTETDFEASWREAIAGPPAGANGVLVATDAGVVAGHLAFAEVDGQVEVTTLVVDPGHWGRGHGSRLLAAFADQVGPGAEAFTWTPLADEARRGFLLSAGWGPDGAYRDLDRDTAPAWREIRLVTRLE